MLGRSPEALTDASNATASLGIYVLGQPPPHSGTPFVPKGAGDLTPVLYAYNDKNQMVEAKTASSTVTNTFNAEGLRVSKTVEDVTTWYCYEFNQVIKELDSEGSIAYNTYGTNLISRDLYGEKVYYIFNGHGDVTGLLSSSGAIIASYYYDAYGNILEQSGNFGNPYRYAGYMYDSETELYNLNARFYDAKLARFMQEDTYLGDRNDPLSLNLYAYCLNDPIKYHDPTGRSSVAASVSKVIKDGFNSISKLFPGSSNSSSGGDNSSNNSFLAGVLQSKINNGSSLINKLLYIPAIHGRLELKKLPYIPSIDGKAEIQLLPYSPNSPFISDLLAKLGINPSKNTGDIMGRLGGINSNVKNTTASTFSLMATKLHKLDRLTSQNNGTVNPNVNLPDIGLYPELDSYISIVNNMSVEEIIAFAKEVGLWREPTPYPSSPPYYQRITMQADKIRQQMIENVASAIVKNGNIDISNVDSQSKPYLEHYLSVSTRKDPITVVEYDNSIIIYAYVSIYGGAAELSLSSTSYRQATINGIMRDWGGDYDGKAVKVVILDLNDGDRHYTKSEQNNLKIEIKKGDGVSNVHSVGGLSNTWSLAYNGKITMYQGLPGGTRDYTYGQYTSTAAHEFGHTLGIANLYDDIDIPVKFPSIMNNEYTVSGAQAVDYAMMLKAQSTGKYQIWSKNKKLLDEMNITYK